MNCTGIGPQPPIAASPATCAPRSATRCRKRRSASSATAAWPCWPGSRVTAYRSRGASARTRPRTPPTATTSTTPAANCCSPALPRPLPGPPLPRPPLPRPPLPGRRFRGRHWATRPPRPPDPGPRHVGRPAARPPGRPRVREPALALRAHPDRRPLRLVTDPSRPRHRCGVPVPARCARRGPAGRPRRTAAGRSSRTCTCRSSAGSCTGRRKPVLQRRHFRP